MPNCSYQDLVLGISARSAAFLLALGGVMLGASGCGRMGFELLPPVDASVSSGGGSGTNSGGTLASGGGSTGAGGAVMSGGATTSGGAISSGGAMALDAGMTDAAAAPDAAIGPQPDSCSLGGAVYALGAAAPLSGTLEMTATHSGKCLALSGCAAADRGANIVQQTCDYSTCQNWEPVDLGNGWYALRNPFTGHCLDVEDSGVPSSNLVQWDCGITASQQFQATCAGYDEWRLVAYGSGDSLTVDGASMSDGALITQTADTELGNQRWTIESQAGVFSPIVPTADTGSGQTWKYTTSAPASGWDNLGFDDSAWMQGDSGFGANEGGLLVIRTPWTTSDIWMRVTFSLSAPLPTALSLRLSHDESLDVYLNGVLVFTTSNTWMSGYLQTPVSAAGLAALVEGDNVLTAHCNNTTTAQYVDVGLGTYQWQVTP